MGTGWEDQRGGQGPRAMSQGRDAACLRCLGQPQAPETWTQCYPFPLTEAGSCMPVQTTIGAGWSGGFPQSPPPLRQATPAPPPPEPQGSSPTTGLTSLFHDLHPMPSALLRAPTPNCSKVRNGWHMHALNWPLEDGI